VSTRHPLRSQQLEAAPHWHNGKHITERHQQSCWLIEKAVMCMRAYNRTSLWTSAKLKNHFSEPPHYTTVSFQSHQQSTKENVPRHFCRSYSYASKLSKSEWTMKVEYAYHFWKCADAVYQKLSKLVCACRNYSMPKFPHFLRHNV